ncbi:MAG: ATP-binding protein [Candidatus Acidiferrales bacterium]
MRLNAAIRLAAPPRISSSGSSTSRASDPRQSYNSGRLLSASGLPANRKNPCVSAGAKIPIVPVEISPPLDVVNWSPLHTEEVPKLVKGARRATAILDRLLHHSTTINIRGESYRLKDRRKAGLVPPRGQEGAEAAAHL